MSASVLRDEGLAGRIGFGATLVEARKGSSLGPYDMLRDGVNG